LRNQETAVSVMQRILSVGRSRSVTELSSIGTKDTQPGIVRGVAGLRPSVMDNRAEEVGRVGEAPLRIIDIAVLDLRTGQRITIDLDLRFVRTGVRILEAPQVTVDAPQRLLAIGKPLLGGIIRLAPLGRELERSFESGELPIEFCLQRNIFVGQFGLRGLLVQGRQPAINLVQQPPNFLRAEVGVPLRGGCHRSGVEKPDAVDDGDGCGNQSKHVGSL
jgi:hypothetical protein